MATRTTGKPARTKRHPLATWTGSERRYDLIAEGTIAVVLIAVLCIVAAILWGSPDGGLTYPKALASRKIGIDEVERAVERIGHRWSLRGVIAVSHQTIH